MPSAFLLKTARCRHRAPRTATAGPPHGAVVESTFHIPYLHFFSLPSNPQKQFYPAVAATRLAVTAMMLSMHPNEDNA
jgi:hypothetical protein